MFPNDSWKRFVGVGFEKFWVTDSIPTTTRKLANVKPFEILSIAPIVAYTLGVFSGRGGITRRVSECRETRGILDEMKKLGSDL